MAHHAKSALQLARQLYAASLSGGTVSAERVAGVLEYVETRAVANPVLVLRAYRRLVAAELARGVADVEHAGAIDDGLLASIAAAMTRRYGRPVAAAARPNPALIAGLRIRVADDVYEASVAGQLAALEASV